MHRGTYLFLTYSENSGYAVCRAKEEMLKCLLLTNLLKKPPPFFSWLIGLGLCLYPGLLWLDPSLRGLSAPAAGGRGAELCSQGNIGGGNKSH